MVGCVRAHFSRSTTSPNIKLALKSNCHNSSYHRRTSYLAASTSLVPMFILRCRGCTHIRLIPKLAGCGTVLQHTIPPPPGVEGEYEHRSLKGSVSRSFTGVKGEATTASGALSSGAVSGMGCSRTGFLSGVVLV